MADYWHSEISENEMKAAYLITGSGNTFYCSNCHRDRLYVTSLKNAGIDTEAVPLYLPPIGEDFGEEFENPVFFGAVSMFLRERVKLFDHMPAFMDKILDAPPLLKLAAKKAGTTRPEGFEETTLNMIRGNDPSRVREINRLTAFLSKERKPDVIHLSNALIIGLAGQLKEAMGSSIVCSLQNEDDWLDEMAEPYRTDAWKLIGEESVNVDVFVSPSEYFKQLVVERTGIDPSKIVVIHSGLEETRLLSIEREEGPPAIGYYSRLSRQNGLDKIVDAFIILSGEGKHPGLQLHLCGGYTADNKHFISEQLKKLHDHKLDSHVKVYSAFNQAAKDELFRSIDLMSVPVNKHDAYGLYLLTANQAGVPVVQPATGAFPEIIEATGGGITYIPDTAENLARAISNLLEDRKATRNLGLKGREGVMNNFTTTRMAEKLMDVYKTVTGESKK